MQAKKLEVNFESDDFFNQFDPDVIAKKQEEERARQEAERTRQEARKEEERRKKAEEPKR